MNWKPLLEALKEPLRLALLAVIAWAILYVVPGVQDPQWGALLLLILKTLDKIVHEYGKETGNQALVTGLTRF